ncbi:expressed protein [Echinococcus multilocularis]|uniref:Expressed protein n=1 Tax=Echinococcus multilocularis TaxID=6211 RepID=A0A068YF80_ECHMU|nr:expressed protein [Echinococcus multilocularis]
MTLNVYAGSALIQGTFGSIGRNRFGSRRRIATGSTGTAWTCHWLTRCIFAASSITRFAEHLWRLGSLLATRTFWIAALITRLFWNVERVLGAHCKVYLYLHLSGRTTLMPKLAKCVSGGNFY